MFQMVADHLCIDLSTVMQFIWDHTFGKQEQQDLVVCKPMAIFEPDDEAEALSVPEEAGAVGAARGCP